MSSLSGRKEFLYEGDEPIADYKMVGSTEYLTMRYLHGAAVDERLMVWQYNDTSGAQVASEYYLTNHQGSVVATASSSTGQRVNKYTYDAYGTIGDGEGASQPFRYTGRRWDEETGLYYYRARYYSAKLGRFLQTDPIGYEDNMNLYGYTANDPINNADPSGKAAVGAVCLIPVVTGACVVAGDAIFTGLVAILAAVTLTSDSVDGNDDSSSTPGIGDNGGPPLDEEPSEGGQGPNPNDAAATAAITATTATITDDNADPRTEVGRLGNEIYVAPGTNAPGNVNGRDFSGHSFDRTQGRGIPPSVVENTIRTGTASPGNTPGTTQYYDPVNNMTVVVNSSTGRVVTVRPGK